jgi:hypothetical protein
MALLEAKLLDLAAKDVTVEASLKTAGAIPTAASCADIGKVIGGKLVEAPPVDIAKVDRALISRAKAHVHAALAVPKPFTHEGITITITALVLESQIVTVPPFYERDANGDAIMVRDEIGDWHPVILIPATQYDNGTLRVDLTTDLDPRFEDKPYRFVNPPLQKVTREAVYDEKAEGLPVILEPRVTEDAPDEVLQTIVGQAVHGAAVARGWEG